MANGGWKLIGVALFAAGLAVTGLIAWGSATATADDHERRVTVVESKKLDKDSYHREMLLYEKRREDDRAVMKANQENIQHIQQSLTMAVEAIGGDLKVIKYQLRQK